MRCALCRVEDSAALLPGWRHVDRGVDERGITRHLWWATLIANNGLRFEAGVEVSYAPGPLGTIFKWMLQPEGQPGQRSTGAPVGGSVERCLWIMTVDEGSRPSMMERWAARIERQRKPPREPKWLPATPPYVSPF